MRDNFKSILLTICVKFWPFHKSNFNFKYNLKIFFRIIGKNFEHCKTKYIQFQIFIDFLKYLGNLLILTLLSTLF